MSADGTLPKWLSAARRARPLAAAVSVALIIALAIAADPFAVVGALDGRAVWIVFLVAVLYLANGFLKAYRWWILLRAQGVEASYWEAYRAFLVGMAFNNLLPSGLAGEPVRILQLEGRVTAATAGATTADRMLDAIVIVAIGAAGVPLLLAGLDPSSVRPMVIALVVFTAVLVVVAIVVWRRWRLGWLVTRPAAAITAGVMTIPIQANDGLRLLLVAGVYGIHLGFWKAIAIVALATLAGLIAVLGGGAGLAVSVGALLSAVGANPPDAAAASLIFVATSTWLSFPLGALAALAPNRRDSRQPEATWT